MLITRKKWFLEGPLEPQNRGPRTPQKWHFWGPGPPKSRFWGSRPPKMTILGVLDLKKRVERAAKNQSWTREKSLSLAFESYYLIKPCCKAKRLRRGCEILKIGPGRSKRPEIEVFWSQKDPKMAKKWAIFVGPF